MANQLSEDLRKQLFGQESEDPFLTLVTLSHANFSTIRLVNNYDDVTSRGHVYTAYPFRINMPPDDGESAKTAQIEIDNTTLEFIDEIRSSTTPIDVKIEMILASKPNIVQLELPMLKTGSVVYNTQSLVVTLVMDGFLQTSLDAERYTPSLYPGLF